MLEEAARQALESTPAGSRSGALFLLYQAAYPLGESIVSPLLRHLIALQKSPPHWRVSHALVHALAMHSVIAPDSFSLMISSVSNPRIFAGLTAASLWNLHSHVNFFGRHDPHTRNSKAE